MSTSNVIFRELGKGGPKVSALGFGAMGLSTAYGDLEPDEVNHETIKLAVELGCTLIDTADVYGNPMGLNERLIGELLKDKEFRSKVFICTKFGIDGNNGYATNGRPEYIRSRLEASLRNLQVDYVDLYYQHRVDRTIPIEETWTELAALQKSGKIKHLGISEATPDEIRRANKIAKISALQIEFSPWTPDIRENGILDTCRELGITIVAYSPLGRGFLTGAYKSIDDLDASDWRRTVPRFAESFAENLKLVDALKAIAEKKDITPAQLCLAWVLAQGEDFIAIPGTKKAKYLRDNVGCRDVTLTAEEIAAIDEITQRIKAVGERYPAGMQNNAF